MAVQAMAGVFQLSPEESLRDAELAFKIGVPAVLLSAIPKSNTAGTPILNASSASLRDSSGESWNTPAIAWTAMRTLRQIGRAARRERALCEVAGAMFV